MTVKYTPDHEWINLADAAATVVGITVHAQDALGDVVFVDLPEVGRTYAKGEVAGVVESVKAAADVYMPLSGEVVEVNEALRADPSLANSDPLGAGWFFKVKAADVAETEGLLGRFDAYGMRFENAMKLAKHRGASTMAITDAIGNSANQSPGSRPRAHLMPPRMCA